MSHQFNFFFGCIVPLIIMCLLATIGGLIGVQTTYRTDTDHLAFIISGFGMGTGIGILVSRLIITKLGTKW